MNKQFTRYLYLYEEVELSLVLSLLNKHYPMRGKNCDILTIQRLFQYGSKKNLKGGNFDDEEEF